MGLGRQLELLLFELLGELRGLLLEAGDRGLHDVVLAVVLELAL